MEQTIDNRPVQVGEAYTVQFNEDGILVMDNEKEIICTDETILGGFDNMPLERFLSEFIYLKKDKCFIVKINDGLLVQKELSDSKDILVTMLDFMDDTGWNCMGKGYIYFFNMIREYIEK